MLLSPRKLQIFLCSLGATGTEQVTARYQGLVECPGFRVRTARAPPSRWECVEIVQRTLQNRVQYDMCSRHASLSELARSPVRSSAAPRSGTAGERGASVGVAASVGQPVSRVSYGSRCSGGHDGLVAAVRPSLRAGFLEACQESTTRGVSLLNLAGLGHGAPLAKRGTQNSAPGGLHCMIDRRAQTARASDTKVVSHPSEGNLRTPSVGPHASPSRPPPEFGVASDASSPRAMRGSASPPTRDRPEEPTTFTPPLQQDRPSGLSERATCADLVSSATQTDIGRVREEVATFLTSAEQISSRPVAQVESKPSSLSRSCFPTQEQGSPIQPSARRRMRSAASGAVEEMTARKCQDEVGSWAAYLATLLRNFGPKLREPLAERDSWSRLRDRRGLDRGQDVTVSLHVSRHAALLLTPRQDFSCHCISPVLMLTTRGALALQQLRHERFTKVGRLERRQSRVCALTSNDQLSRSENAPQPVGTLSATLERGRWLSVSSCRMHITERLSVLGPPKALPGGGCVGECRLWSRNVSEAGAALARGPAIRGARTENSGDQRAPKIMCEQSAVPSSSDIKMRKMKKKNKKQEKRKN